MNCSECLFICLSFFSNVCPGRKKQPTQEPPTAQQFEEPLLNNNRNTNAVTMDKEKTSSEWSLVKVPPYEEECEIISIASTIQEYEEDDFACEEYDIIDEYGPSTRSNKHSYALLSWKEFYPKIYNRKDLPAIKTAQVIILKYLESQKKPLEFTMIQNIITSIFQENISFATSFFGDMTNDKQEKFVRAVISTFRKNMTPCDDYEKELCSSVKDFIKTCKASFIQCQFFLKSFVDFTKIELKLKTLPSFEESVLSIKKTLKNELEETPLSTEICIKMVHPKYLDQGKWIGFCTDSSCDKFSAFEPLDNHLKSMLIKNIVSFYLRSDVLSDIDYQATLKIFSKYNIPPMIITCLENDLILVNV